MANNSIKEKTVYSPSIRDVKAIFDIQGKIINIGVTQTEIIIETKRSTVCKLVNYLKTKNRNELFIRGSKSTYSINLRYLKERLKIEGRVDSCSLKQHVSKQGIPNYHKWLIEMNISRVGVY